MIYSALKRAMWLLRAIGRQLKHTLNDCLLFLRGSESGVAFREAEVLGMPFLVRADEDVGRSLYFYGRYECEESACFRRLIRDSDICVDVGANTGYYTMLFARTAQKGRVHAFEPVPLNFHMLSVNILSNGLQNVILNNSAVGQFNGETEFTFALDGAFSSFIDTARRSVVDRATVPVITLDSYCEASGIHRIDCLKIDVEGAESQVLAGTSNLFNNAGRKPRLIMLELYDPMLHQYNSSIDEILASLEAYGYSPFIWSHNRKAVYDRKDYNRFYNVFFSLTEEVKPTKEHRSLEDIKA